MAIHFASPDPGALLRAFNARIAQRESEGKITTWEKSPDGQYYTHKAAEWRGKAWFKPLVSAGQLIFNIMPSQNGSVTTVVYGYYHGHLLETFLNHFDDQFSTGSATARPTGGDRIR